MLSTQVKHLTQIEQQRYLDKIAIFGVGDPYLLPAKSLSKVLECEAADLPAITFPDIYMFLINRESTFTNETLKAYKSLEAYKYFVSGFVSDVCVFKAKEKTCIVMSKVSTHINCNFCNTSRIVTFNKNFEDQCNFMIDVDYLCNLSIYYGYYKYNCNKGFIFHAAI